MRLIDADKLIEGLYVDRPKDIALYIAEQPTIEPEGKMISYNNSQTGDRVVVLGTVTDVSESGVQTIEPDKDAEGFVISRKLPIRYEIGKDEGIENRLIKGSWNACLTEITGGTDK